MTARRLPDWQEEGCPWPGAGAYLLRHFRGGPIVVTPWGWMPARGGARELKHFARLTRRRLGMKAAARVYLLGADELRYRGLS